VPCRDLDNNQIASLPAGVFNGSNYLQTLSLGLNKLQEVPDSLFLVDKASLSITSLAEGNFLSCLPIFPPNIYSLLDVRTSTLSTCACNQGTYLESWQAGCSVCLAGSCSAGHELCPEGSKSPDECSICSPGSYSTSGVQCLSCPFGTFQDAAGQTACKSCPSGMSTIAQGSISNSSCVCQAGYFHDAGSSDLLAGGGKEIGGFDGVGAQAVFSVPAAIAISSDGNFAVVAETQSHVIRILNMSTGETRLIAGSGTPGYEGWDNFVLEGSETNVDSQNYGFAGVYGSSAKFSRPSGVALTPDDKYAIVADTGDPEIACLSLLRGPGNLSGECIDSMQNVLICE
jgi:hypothetical protein